LRIAICTAAVVACSPRRGGVRSQLEKYIIEELGVDYLQKWKNQTELKQIKKEMADQYGF
jgi:hypothetical protein